MKRLSYYFIVGRSTSLCRWHLDQVVRNAGLDRDDYDINVVIYRNKKIPQAVTNEIVDICLSEYKANIGFYDEPHDNFLVNLYNCWNYGYNMGAAPIVLRAGSDQAWSPNSFKNIVDAHERYSTQELVTQVHTVEADIATGSRHWTKPWGHTWDTFKEEEFIKFAAEQGREGLYTIQEALSIWGHPTSFSNSLGPNRNRVDSVSWCMSRKLFEKVGPMEPIGIYGLTGDVLIHDRIEMLGITEYLVGNTFSYHLCRGESRGFTQ